MGHTFSTSGVSYEDSPDYDPGPAISGWDTYRPVFRKDTPFSLSSQDSITFTGDQTPVSYLWSIEEGPDDQSSPETTDEVTITADTKGEYTVRLTITDDNMNTAYI